MKSFYLFSLILLATSNSFSFEITPPDSTSTIIEKSTAKFFISEGKKTFNEGNFRGALVKFREALAKDKNNAEANYWVGECHIELGNFDTALKYGLLAYNKNPNIHNEITYSLGLCYQNLSDLDLALENYEKSLALIGEKRALSLRIPTRIEECKRAKNMMSDPIKIKITALGKGVNSMTDEYAPLLINGGKTLYFTSRRADNEGGGISPGDKKYFSDIYVSYWNDTTNTWGQASNVNQEIKRLNTIGFESVSSISADGSILYLTINTDGLVKPKPKTKSTDIFYSKLNSKGTWGTPKALAKKTINTMYFEAGISLTDDGNTAYFTSERSGGQGLSDIWFVKKEGKSWGKPQNMGPIVNSKYDETTVYVTGDEKYLFFSSKGHEGIGGYDVYYCVNENGIWSKPKNLGFPINSVSDETHFQYYPKYNKAYYSKISKNGDGGVGARDIFEIDLTDVDLLK